MRLAPLIIAGSIVAGLSSPSLAQSRWPPSPINCNAAVNANSYYCTHRNLFPYSYNYNYDYPGYGAYPSAGVSFGYDYGGYAGYPGFANGYPGMGYSAPSFAYGYPTMGYPYAGYPAGYAYGGWGGAAPLVAAAGTNVLTTGAVARPLYRRAAVRRDVLATGSVGIGPRGRAVVPRTARGATARSIRR